MSGTPDVTPVALSQQTPAPASTPTAPSSTTPATPPSSETTNEPSLLNQPTDEGAPESKPESPKGAPEAYEAFKAPEGYELDKAAIDKATPIFKELNLDQAGAQKLIDFYSELSKEAAEGPARLAREQNEAWVNELKSDPEIGGKLDQVRVDVSKMLSLLGPLEAPFRQAMDYTGSGNNPAFVRGLNFLAGLVVERGLVKGNGPSAQGQGSNGARPTAAKALYPNLP